MRRIIYVPTHRSSIPAVQAAVRECAVLRESTGIDHVVVVVEHAPAAWVDSHASELLRARREHQVPTLHLTVERWRKILDSVVEGHTTSTSEARRLKALLSPTDIAYSAGPNKAFLIAAALGADTVHRRDSDHVPDHRDGTEAFPGVLEASAIGRPLKDAIALTDSDDMSDDERNAIVYFVGSSMFGDPPHDRRDLLKIDEGLVARIEQLSSPHSSVDELLAEVREYFVEEPSIRYDRDFYELDQSGRTELGVSCLQRIFLELPEMPIRNTLGCDYFQKNLLYQLHRPVVFHSRKMRHAYDHDRAQGVDVQSFVDYSLRDLNYLILWRVWTSHNQTIRAHRSEFLAPDGSLDAERYAESLSRAAAAVLPEVTDIPERYSAIYHEASTRADGARAERLRAVAGAAEAKGVGAIDEVAQGVEDYVWLIRRWQPLIKSASSSRSTVERYVASPAAGADSV